MRVFYHSNQQSFLDQSSDDSSFKIKIVCEDGVVICDRLLFILWSKKWMELLNPNEETSLVMFPDVKQRTMELALNILRKGNTEGFESDFQNMFELTLDFLADVPGGFSNFETSDKSLEVKAESMKIQREKRNKFKTLRNATCEFCLSNFYNKQAKERHIENVHQPKEKFNCSDCNLSFKSKIGLNTHKKRKHSNAGEYSCSYSQCDAKFSVEANLKRHILSVHNTEYTCYDCRKKFNSYRKLDQHQKKFRHGGEGSDVIEEGQEFKCPKCHFKTSRKDSLLRHKRLKHGIYTKEFTVINETLKENSSWTCSKCNKTYTSYDEIEDHVVNCEEFKCKLCDKDFTLKSSLKRHLEKKHTAVCKNCNERFKTNKRLRKHQEGCMKDASKDDTIKEMSKDDEIEKEAADGKVEEASKADDIEKVE